MRLANQCIAHMGRKKGLEPMQRLTTNHYRTKIALLRRVENISSSR